VASHVKELPVSRGKASITHQDRVRRSLLRGFAERWTPEAGHLSACPFCEIGNRDSGAHYKYLKCPFVARLDCTYGDIGKSLDLPSAGSLQKDTTSGLIIFTFTCTGKSTVVERGGTNNFRNGVTANGNTDVIMTRAQKMRTPLTLE
jgi:hypothetical protein